MRHKAETELAEKVSEMQLVINRYETRFTEHEEEKNVLKQQVLENRS